LLAVLGGNAAPSADDLKNILSSVGAEADDADITKLITELEGKDITEVIAAGTAKLASVPSGGGGGSVPVAAAAAGAAGAMAGSEAAKAPEPEPDDEDEEDEIGFDLFD